MNQNLVSSPIPEGVKYFDNLFVRNSRGQYVERAVPTASVPYVFIATTHPYRRVLRYDVRRALHEHYENMILLVMKARINNKVPEALRGFVSQQFLNAINSRKS
jgi:hypothetical protein